MEYQNEPVAEDEIVYRRVHRSFFDPAVLVPIRAAAFRPNANDESGLSVFRARFVTSGDTLTNVAESKRNAYLVVELSVKDLNGLGLTVVAEPDPDGPPGHAVIPELSWAAYVANKK